MSISVGQAAATRDLTLVAAVKAELGVVVPDDDALLGALVSQVSDAIAVYCNRVFVIETVTETLVTDRTRKLVLSRTPIVSITSLIATPWRGSPQTSITADAIDASAGIVTYDAGWPNGRVAATYVGGYVTPALAASTGQTRTLPFDVERAALEWAKALYLARGRDPAATNEYVLEVSRTGFAVAEGLPPGVARLLRRWVRAA